MESLDVGTLLDMSLELAGFDDTSNSTLIMIVSLGIECVVSLVQEHAYGLRRVIHCLHTKNIPAFTNIRRAIVGTACAMVKTARRSESSLGDWQKPITQDYIRKAGCS